VSGSASQPENSSFRLRAFESCAEVDQVVVVTHPERVDEFAAAVRTAGCGKVRAVVAGGDTRQLSVRAGLACIAKDTEIVAIHDGARPLVTPDAISASVRELVERPELDGVVVGHPMHDTVKDVGDDGLISSTVDRSRLWVAQTPQVFRVARLHTAFAAAEADGFEGTDDASLVERVGGRVGMVTGSRDNIKVTVAEDLALARAVLAARTEGRA
jgi:2-C-methyl-D-erythritol 4-phosphate cytidylyltransferase